ncbi:MAG TPA: nucleoside-diphosphate sugar epimerase/dehydratase [Bacteroidales bacterium]|nr:nucleoside-diphosphate sugar epimerase/dehydratase [Bacteroidales bacterium]
MISLYTFRNTPRWVIFCIDLAVVVFSVILAYLLRFNFTIPPEELHSFPKVLLFIFLVRAVSFLISRTYAGIIRYTTTADSIRVVITVLSGSLFFCLTNIVTFFMIGRFFFVPFSIIIIDFLVTSFAMLAFRVLVKVAYLELRNAPLANASVIIYGAGPEGITVKHVLEGDMTTRFRVTAFLDDNPAKVGKKLEGVDIHSPVNLEEILETSGVSRLILTIPHFSPEQKQQLVDKCFAYNVKVMTVPPVMNWINGQLRVSQIKDLNIEDLLEREEIRLDEKEIRDDLAGKKILITGAAGSIGSEIARQAARFSPARLLLLDQAETALHELQMEFGAQLPEVDAGFLIMDICNESRMEKAFREERPDIVYHAAAYKHVPVMESHPAEAILTNVLGSRILADLSRKYGVSKFIMISTDKAVNPTSVMGASKRIAEMYTQSLDSTGKTKFITTRFGNVLGSNGSVIPLFRRQIEKGGPVTVTHPEITRFFMTIPEACQLVLNAGAIGKGGEIFIFDMGKSVKILDLARKMIRLSGVEHEKDIQIKFTGLRPGEKLYEELLNREENTLPTHHPLILIAKVKDYDAKQTARQIGELIVLSETGSDVEIVRKMKQIVPEYKSRSSVFEQLD